ncbi:hypothetical protein LINPERPRIM_LOCUS30658, partial [Linum perenne]
SRSTLVTISHPNSLWSPSISTSATVFTPNLSSPLSRSTPTTASRTGIYFSSHCTHICSGSSRMTAEIINYHEHGPFKDKSKWFLL